MLSIIIPTLNEEKHLFLLAESIKKQNFKDYEIIIADAGSRDKTIKIAESYGCRIAPGGLPAKGRNEGAKIAQGDLLMFLDADCLLPPDFLKKITGEFKEKNLDIATGLIRPFGNGKFVRLFYDLIFNLSSLIVERIYPAGTGMILIKKIIHQKIEGFDESLRVGEDHEYIRRAAKLGKYRILRSERFMWSERRFQKEGWFRTVFKYGLMILHAIFLGPVKKDIFKYRFDNYKK